jgi:ABC-2 type transport system permease protein
MGLRSIYAKTVRDSRRAAVLVGLVIGAFMFGTGAPYGRAPEFATLELREQFIAGITALPLALRGLLGEPINVETLGGFLSWRVGNTIAVIFGLWPVIALSGTLAGEATKGSLDLLASTPKGRRSIALQKLAGHITALIAAMLLAALIIWGVGLAFATLPGDEIPFEAALGQVTLYGLLMLAAGSVAFAAGPALGRTRALGLGLVALFAPYLVSSYASMSSSIEAFSPLSWFAWTAGHRPMAGATDWVSLVPLVAVTVLFLGVGVVSFTRRDLGITAAISWLRLPSLPAGIQGPFARQLADRTAVAIAWGVGMGLYGSLIVASAAAFAESLASIPQIAELIATIYPGVDIQQPSGVLQLAFYGFASFLVGLAGASFLAAWAGDENGGRLALVMSVPLSRIRWMLGSGAGVLAAVAVVAAVLATIIGLAVATQGGDVATPVVGGLILGLAAAGCAGIGLAAGGLVRASLAAPVTAFVVIATFLLDTLGAALDLPDWALDLSLYKHLGQPMAGVLDPGGIVAAVALMVGGLLVGAWGLQRRDLDR